MERAPVLTPAFLWLVAGHFLQACGYASMLLFPLYLDHLGASRAQIGAIVASASFGGLCSRPFVGLSLDVWGRRPTLWVGTIFLCVGLFAVSAVDRLSPFVYAVRILYGIGAGTLFTAYFAFAADIIPVSRRTEGIALFGVSGLLPLLVNPLSHSIGVNPTDLRWFLPVVGLIAGLSLWPILVLEEPKREPPQRRRSFFRAGQALLTGPLLPVWFAVMPFSGLVATFMAFATVAAQKAGATDPTAIWLTYACGAVGVRLFGARLPEFVGPRNLVAPAMGSYVIAMIVLAEAHTQPAFLLAGLLGGLAHGYCFPVLMSLVVTRVDPDYRGSGVAAFTALWGAAELMLSPTLGAFADRHGDSAMFAFAGSSATCALALWAALEHRASRKI